MKRLLIIIVCVFSFIGYITAQNANRSGFFIEAGIGGIIGNTPRMMFIVTDNVLQYKCVSGTAIDFGLGFRKRFNTHWAYEFKGEMQSALSSPMRTSVYRILPVGFRYTSIEILKNISVYAHFDIGAAVSVINGKIPSWRRGFLSNDTFFPNTTINFTTHRRSHGFGASFSLGAGLNITTHFYAEVCWNGQTLFDCYGRDGIGVLNGGMIGLLLGYRF